MIVVRDYRGFRIEITAQLVDGARNAGVRLRRTVSDEKPHVQQVTCRKPTAMEAEGRGGTGARRWIDVNGGGAGAADE